jgi:hypothetical protein
MILGESGPPPARYCGSGCQKSAKRLDAPAGLHPSGDLRDLTQLAQETPRAHRLTERQPALHFE